MNFDGFFRYAQRVGDLLVKHPRDDTEPSLRARLRLAPDNDRVSLRVFPAVSA